MNGQPKYQDDIDKDDNDKQMEISQKFEMEKRSEHTEAYLHEQQNS